MTSLDQVLSVGIAFVIIAVALGIGLVVIQDLKLDQMTTETGTTSIVNTSYTGILDVAVDVVAADGEECSVGSCVVINESPDSNVIPASNYSVAFSGCTLQITVLDVLYNNTAQNASCTYTQAVQDYFYNASKAGQEGVTEFSSWLPTIAIVVIAAIVLGIITVYLARRFM